MRVVYACTFYAAFALVVACRDGASKGTTLTLRSGHQVNLTAITRNTETGVSPECGRLTFTELLLQYITGATDSAVRASEIDDLLPIASVYAEKTGDSLVVIRQSSPLLARWIPLTLNYDYRYSRSGNNGYTRADGLWPPWAICYCRAESVAHQSECLKAAR